jgi:hypothetical protein
MITSTRRLISSPSLDRSDRPDVPQHFKNLVDKLDVDVLYTQGTDAARIAAGHQIQGGRLWWTTDTHVLWYDDGTTWWNTITDISGAILKSLIDAKGDLIVGTANDTPARLAVAGSDNQVLVSDAGSAAGVKWTARESTSITQTCGYISADAAAATYVMSIAGVDLTPNIRPGTRIHISQGTEKYFIATAVSYSGGNTLVTMFGGTTYVLANSGIPSADYSNIRFSAGFPVDPSIWDVVVTNGNDQSQNNPSQGNWYNPGSLAIVVPIGTWELGYQAFVQSSYSGGQGELTDFITLSTTTNSESDGDFTAAGYLGSNSNDMSRLGFDGSRTKRIILAAKQTYNLLCKANDPSCSNIGFYGARGGKTRIYARNLYL